MQKITTCLWFDDQAEEAMNFYVSIFKNSKVLSVTRWPKGHPQQGQVLVASFELDGVQFLALNGGPQYKFTEAISLSVNAVDQGEVDRYTDLLTADGGEVGPCGWVKDRFGLSWQIVPDVLPELLADPDPVRANAAMQAMLGMMKIDIQALRDAADAASAPSA